VEKAAIQQANPNISPDELNQQARAKVLEPWYKTNKSYATWDEIKEISDVQSDLQKIEIAYKANATPEQIAQIEELKKLWYTKAKIAQDILSKPGLTPEDMYTYWQLVKAAKNKDVLLRDLVSATQYMDTKSQSLAYWAIKEYNATRTVDSLVAKSPFWVENPQEIDYLSKSVFGKLSPTEKYTLTELWDVAKNVADESKNPLKIHTDILEKEWDEYKFFRRNDDWTYSLNVEWHKKLWYIDQRWKWYVLESTEQWWDFYRAVEEAKEAVLKEWELENMRSVWAYEKVYNAVKDVVPCI
jgi:hypothetical protein